MNRLFHFTTDSPANRIGRSSNLIRPLSPLIGSREAAKIPLSEVIRYAFSSIKGPAFFYSLRKSFVSSRANHSSVRTWNRLIRWTTNCIYCKTANSSNVLEVAFTRSPTPSSDRRRKRQQSICTKFHFKAAQSRKAKHLFTFKYTIFTLMKKNAKCKGHLAVSSIP